MALTTVATAAAVCMVIWVSSGYEALHQTYDDYADLALGRYELAIAPISAADTDFVAPEVLPQLRRDPAVRAVEPMWANRFGVRTDAASAGDGTFNPTASSGSPTRGPGTGPLARLPSMMFLALDSDVSPFDIIAGTWIDMSASTAPQVVLRQDVAAQRGLDIDDFITVELPRPGLNGESQLDLRVVGIVSAPALMGAEAVGIPMLTPSTGEAFIATPVAERIAGRSSQISLLGVAVNPDADITSFRFGWAPRLSGYATPLQFQEAFEIEEALDQASAAENVKLQTYAATGVAMLVAMLVIYCTLSMGVSERTRQYAILRAVVFTRRQIGWLILIEAFVLGTLGLVAGIAIGWMLLQIVESVFAGLLHHGVGFGANSLLLAGIAGIGGALLAAIVPAYRAIRVKPVDAMAPRQESVMEASIHWPLVTLAVILISVTPLLALVIPLHQTSIAWAMGIGFACAALGFILITPPTVILIDRWLSPIFSRVFRIDPKLVSSQITSNVWRAVGASLSLAFGLSLFIGIQVWGFTMLQAFIPGDWVPDAIVMMEPGLPPDRVAEFAALPDVDASRCLPLVVEQPRLAGDPTDSAARASVVRQDNVVIVGLDPLGAFGGETPLLKLEWTAGDPVAAVERMKQGHACVVPNHFLVEAGLEIGDTITLDPPRNAGQRCVYEIVGGVELPGWHWQTKLTGLRTRTHRAAALVFADYESVAEDFDLNSASHIWFSCDHDDAVDWTQLEQSAQTLVASLRSVEASPDGEAAGDVNVVPVQQIRDHLDGAARRWIWVTSCVPLTALLIACLGVLNVMLASVRARRWEFGVMRAIGITRSELTRAILVEGILIAFVAIVLSLGFGILSGWFGCVMAQHISFFGGLHPPLMIPWLPILGAITLVLLLGILSAAWPAVSIGRARPMELLQTGSETG
ncbi:Macrolide export ATP-binding/permease protein MacB [Allorhodopirellula solitaria]|uniref:Macrolide export ATP-binding/permease protein MacB n=1 Tax=Allorhodopirellula solitaria TaxID=2527987 RepID=A0A5C5XQ31_9BACT|nr:Macrolide export ATP-binding/permease protein MacB [Allorhodopirellula solitaria]